MRFAAAVIAVTLALLAACTVERQVLVDMTVLSSCDAVWAGGAPGDACDLPDQCTRDNPDNPMCCVDYAYCRVGELVMDTTCNLDCAACLDDHGCTYGAAQCNSEVCEPCEAPDPAGGTSCEADCPPGWSYLTRNGCTTCACAPPSECNLFDPASCADMPEMLCIEGSLRGDDDCAPDDVGCFIGACGAPACPSPAPLGCLTDCRDGGAACSQCATTRCTCDPATLTWSCDDICVDGYGLSFTCSF